MHLANELAEILSLRVIENVLPEVSLFCMQKRRIHAKGHPSGVFYYEFFQKRKGGRQCAL